MFSIPKERSFTPDEIDINELGDRITIVPPTQLFSFQTRAEDVVDKGSLIASLFRRETTIGSIMSSVNRGSFGIKDFDKPIGAFLEWVPERNMNRFEAYALTTSQEEADVVTRALEREDMDRARVMATPLKSFAMGIGVQMLDPINWLPGGIIFNNFKKTAHVAKGIVQGAESALVSTALQEGILQSTQFSREAEESYQNILASGIIGMVIGGGAGMLAAKSAHIKSNRATYNPTTGKFEKDVSGVSEVFDGGPEPTAPSVKPEPDGPQPMPPGKRDYAVSELVDVLTDKPTPLSKEGTLNQEQLRNMPEILKKGMFATPMNQLLSSDFSIANKVGNELYEHNYTILKNQYGSGNLNAESNIKVELGKANKVLVEYQDAFFSQIGIKAGALSPTKFALAEKSGNILNFAEFEKSVALEIITGEVHPNASVNRAAKLVKERIFDRWGDELIALDLLEDGVTPRNAQGYYTQSWNIEKIKANEVEFYNFTLDWFKEVNGYIKTIRSQAMKSELPGEVSFLKEQIKTVKLKEKEFEVGFLKSLKEKLKATEEKLSNLYRDIAETMLKPEEVDGLFHTKGPNKGKLRTVQTRQKIETQASQTVNRIIGRDDSQITSNIVYQLAGKPKPLKERVFLVPQARAFDWMNQSTSQIVSGYLQSIVPIVEMTKLARKNKFKSIFDWRSGRVEELSAEFKLAKQGLSKEKNKILGDKFDKQVKNIHDSFDIILGVYGAGANIHDGSYAKFYRTMLAWNYSRLLGFMTLSSIPDLGLNVFTHGPYQSIHHGLLPILKSSQSIIKTMSKDDLKAIGLGLNTVLGARMKAIAGHEDPSNMGTFFGAKFDRIVDTFGNVTLMNQWNDGVQNISGIMSINRTLKTIDSLMKGEKVDLSDTLRIAQLGIDESQIALIHEMWTRAGRPEDGGTFIANWTQWKTKNIKEADALKAFQASVLREVDSVVIVPGKGDKPRVAQEPLGKLLFQFKSFQFSATNKIMFAGLQKHDANMYYGMITMLTLGALSYIVSQAVRGNDDIDYSFKNLSREAIDRSGLVGIISDVYNIAEKAGLGFGSTTSRYQSRGIWGAVLGPSVGTVEDMIGFINAIRNSNGEKPLTTKDAEKLLRLAPYQNLFYTYWLSRKFISSMGPSVGLKSVEKEKFSNLF